MWSDYTNTTGDYSFTTSGAATTLQTTYVTLPASDPLIDWFPNSCLYPKYIPTWHLIQSYRVD